MRWEGQNIFYFNYISLILLLRNKNFRDIKKQMAQWLCSG